MHIPFYVYRSSEKCKRKKVRFCVLEGFHPDYFLVLNQHDVVHAEYKAMEEMYEPKL